MKRKLMITVLALSLVALLAAMLVACDPSGNPNDDGSMRDFERGKYTVTFNTNSDMVLSNPKISDIPYNTKIEAPKDSDGNEIVPVKRGYDFKGWSADGKTEFNFSTTPITSNLTLTAMYTARTFKHTANLDAKLVYNEQDNTFSIQDNARDEGEVGIEANAKLETVYDSLNSLSSPTAKNSTFCFWYYMQDGKPVQLTRWKEADKADVDLLTKYNLTRELEIYPMFEDNLPKVTVKYVDSIGSATYDQFTKSYIFGQNIPVSEMPDPTELQHSEYSFNYWYYITKEEDKDGNAVDIENIFVYDDGNAKNVTSPSDAAGAENNFKPVTLTLFAKWTKEIKIGSVDDFMEIYNKLRNANPTEAEKTEIERILTANITITADLKFGDRELEPLFDSEHIFSGTIEGGIFSDNNVLRDRYTISGGKFGSKTEASVFGYNDGVINNLEFNNVGLVIKKDNGKYANTVQIGNVTTQNRGVIHGCIVVSSGMRLEGLNTVVFGAVSAVNRIKDGTTGAITSCGVTLTNFSAECEALTFGGIVGICNPTARLSKCTVHVATVSSVVCKDDGVSSNGTSALVMGGLVGNNSGNIALCIVANFDVEKVESLTDFSFGGIAGTNTGSIRTTHSAATLCSAQAPANVSGTLAHTVGIGGMVGRNEGYAINSYCDIKAYAQVKSAQNGGFLLSVGGIMGDNYSNRKDTSSATTSGIGAINYCYSTGEIVVNVAENVKNVNVYAGGIAGRNSHNKLGSIFTAVNLTVDNAGKNNLGYMFGAMENKSTVNAKCHYIDENKLMLNGIEYSRVPVEGGDDIESFPITAIGTVLLKSQFGSDSILTTLGFTKDDPWMIDKEYDYPIFNNKIYN